MSNSCRKIGLQVVVALQDSQEKSLDNHKNIPYWVSIKKRMMKKAQLAQNAAKYLSLYHKIWSITSIGYIPKHGTVMRLSAKMLLAFATYGCYQK